MKKSEIQALREKSVEELTAVIAESRAELLKGRFQTVLEGQGLGPRARQLKRQVARCLTIIEEKKAEV